MNEALAMLQQAFDILRAQATALWNVLSAVAANKPEPARNVLVYTAAFVVLLVFTPKIIKKLR